VSGPNDFKLVINDLSRNTAYAKYVDDTTVLSLLKMLMATHFKLVQDYRVHWTQSNGMTTNKTKELIIYLF